MTLAEICRRHVQGEIHFLKIDVEGAEAQVLAGADFVAFRPWVLVIEATTPLMPSDASAVWEPGLLAHNYRFAWFDGLNRFYVAAEYWAALGRHFTVPPNAFDGFTIAAQETRVIAAQLARTEAELALLRLAAPAAPGLPGLPLRFAKTLRSFLSAELRQEIAILRGEIARLAAEIETMRRLPRG